VLGLGFKDRVRVRVRDQCLGLRLGFKVRVRVQGYG
jgi:hypothetical protein